MKWAFGPGNCCEECFNLVKEMAEAKREKEAKTACNKAARAAAKKTRVAATNDLGAQVAGKIQSNADIRKLKVDELKSALSFKGVAYFNTLKKAQLVALALQELGLPETAPNEASDYVCSADADIDPSAFIDSDENSESECESEEDDALE